MQVAAKAVVYASTDAPQAARKGFISECLEKITKAKAHVPGKLSWNGREIRFEPGKPS